MKNWWKLIPVTTVKQGDRLPWWAGVMWWDYQHQFGWVGLLPFNLLARVIRLMWCWIKHPFRVWDAVYEADYQRRVNATYRKGWCARGWCDKREWECKK
jgi:hypothetical protein